MSLLKENAKKKNNLILIFRTPIEFTAQPGLAQLSLPTFEQV